MTLISVTVPTSTSQVKIELQGIPDGLTAIGPLNVPAPMLAYMLPINPQVGFPFVCEGFILGNNLISLNNVFNLTYYLVTVFDPINDGAISSQKFYFIYGDILDLDTATALSEGALPGPPLFVEIVPVPHTASSGGIPGQFACDINFIYVCIANNTWLRAALSTW